MTLESIRKPDPELSPSAHQQPDEELPNLDGGEIDALQDFHRGAPAHVGGASVPPGVLEILSRAEPAALLLDEAGRFVYVNDSARSLLDYSPEDSLDVHFTELCEHESAWLETQFIRLRRNGVWTGRVALKRKRGGVVNVSVNASVLGGDDGNSHVFLAFIHPVRGLAVGQAAVLEDPPFSLSPRDLRALQLLVEGFSIAEIGKVLRESEDAVRALFAEICWKMDVESPAEACVVALKRYLLG